MIMDFLASWELFYATWLAGGLIAALLATVGIWLVARDQIFLGAAVGQASAGGIAAGIWLSQWLELENGHHHGGPDLLLSMLAVGAAMLAALITAPGRRSGRETPESLTGWIFLTGMSGSMLLTVHSPHGTEQMHRLLASTLIGATLVDVAVFACLTVVTWGVLLRQHRTLTLLALDPDMAAAVGVRQRAWSVGVCIWIGLCIGLGMRVSGLLFTFGCLILPSLIARQFCRQVTGLMVLTPVVAVAAAGVGFVLANHYDLPPAQVVVALLGLGVTVGWVVGRGR